MSTSPHTFRTLWRRELKLRFLGMSGWFLVAGFAAAVAAQLLLGVWRERGSAQTLPILFAEAVVWALPPLVALATMRTFAEERSRGTLEMLLTAPVSDRAVVLAKFAASFTVVVVAFAAAVAGLAMYSEIANPPPDYSRTCLGLALTVLIPHAAAWTAAGVLASLFTRSQAAAAAMTFVATLPAALVLSGSLSNAFPGTGLAAWLGQMKIRQAALGTLDTRQVVLGISMLFLLLFTAIRALEARRWKL